MLVITADSDYAIMPCCESAENSFSFPLSSSRYIQDLISNNLLTYSVVADCLQLKAFDLQEAVSE